MNFTRYTLASYNSAMGPLIYHILSYLITRSILSPYPILSLSPSPKLSSLELRSPL